MTKHEDIAGVSVEGLPEMLLLQNNYRLDVTGVMLQRKQSHSFTFEKPFPFGANKGLSSSVPFFSKIIKF